jgi:hypothetical protein
MERVVAFHDDVNDNAESPDVEPGRFGVLQERIKKGFLGEMASIHVDLLAHGTSKVAEQRSRDAPDRWIMKFAVLVSW